MKKFCILCFMLITMKFGEGQSLLAGWDFQTTANGGTSIVGFPSTQSIFISNVGLGTLYLDGSNGSSNWLQSNELDAYVGTSINAGGSTGLSMVTTSPACLGLRNGSGNSANNKAIVFKFSMTGYKDLVVSYATVSTPTGFNSQSWAFSLNGVTWTNIQSITPTTSFTLQTLATITSLDNAGTAYLRLVVNGASGTNNQNNKLDNIQFNATSICGSQLWSGSTGTDWNTASNWCNGTIPTASSIVNIPSGLTNYPIIYTADALAASVTISNGASLNMNGIYNLTLSNVAAFTNNGTFTGTTSTGAVIFAGNGTVGGTVIFNNVKINGAVDFGSTGVSTVTGNLTINAGGSAGGIYGTNLINYGSASTLIYNTTLTTGNEWYAGGSGTVTPGAGIPQNVTIQSGTITIPNTGGSNRALAGNLVINSGSTLQMTSGSRDIYIAGNWTNSGGTFNANNRTVFFDGSNPLQTIFGTTTFYNITLQNSVSFGSSVTTVGNTFSNSTGTMDGGTSTIIFTGSTGSIIGSNSKNFYNLQINSPANITHNTSTGNVHIDNGYTNNGIYTEGPTYTTYFDKNSGTTSLSGTGTTTFGNVTIGQSGTIGAGTTLNANAHSFTVSGTNFTFNHSNSTFNGGTATVIFNGATDVIGTALNVTGTTAAFYGITVLNATTMGIDITVNGPLSITNAANKLVINGKTLSLNATVSGSGVLTGSSTSNITVGTSGSAGTLYFDQATGNITNVLKDFTVNTGATATIGNALNIVAGTSPGTVTSNGTINSGNYLTLRSDINGTSRVTASLGSINGDVTVERYIASGTLHPKSWQLLAIPTDGGQTVNQAWQDTASTPNQDRYPGYGTQITGAGGTAAGFDIASSTPSMKTYSPAIDNYVGISNTTGLPIYNKKGYFVFVRGDRSVTAFGQTAKPTTLRTKGLLFTMAHLPNSTTIAANNFESIGNPYASPLDIRNIYKSSGVDEFFYVWDPYLGSAGPTSPYGLGGFVTLFRNANGHYYSNPQTQTYDAGIHDTLQSGQAFFVYASGGGTVSFDENSKVGGGRLVNSPARPPELQQQLRTNLYSVNPDGSRFMADGALNQFGSSYSNAIDGKDARKNTNTSVNLSVKASGSLLAIERRQMVSPQDTIFLNLTGVRAQPYRYEFVAKNINVEGLEGFVEDTYLHTLTPLDLNGTTLIDFTIANIAGSYAADRFRIVFATVNACPGATFTSVKATPQGDKINVNWKVENELNIKDYTVEKSVDSIHFITLLTAAATGNGGSAVSYQAIDEQPIERYNYYRIRSNDKDGKAKTSEVVKVLIGAIKRDITISPNPITDGMIHLRFVNETEGKYGIRLLNKVGQVIMSKQITRMDGSSTELIKWDFKLAHGMYQLEVTKPDGSVKNISVIY